MSAPLETSERVSQFTEALLPMRERLLANLVMIAQIPAPTGQESQRVRFLLDRFSESGLSDVASDEVGNAVGRLSGRKGERNILLVSHLDTLFAENSDHSVTVEA